MPDFVAWRYAPPRIRVNFQPSASISLIPPSAAGECAAVDGPEQAGRGPGGGTSSRVANLLDSLPSKETKNVLGTVEDSEDFDTIFERPVQDQNLLET